MCVCVCSYLPRCELHLINLMCCNRKHIKPRVKSQGTSYRYGQCCISVRRSRSTNSFWELQVVKAPWEEQGAAVSFGCCITEVLQYFWKEAVHGTNSAVVSVGMVIEDVLQYKVQCRNCWNCISYSGLVDLCITDVEKGIVLYLKKELEIKMS